MKEKLEVIREALNFYESNYEEVIYENEGKTYREIEATDNLVFDEGKTAKKALTLLDSLIAELESPQLVDRISEAIGIEVQDYEQRIQGNAKAEDVADIAAQAAINAIKETATRDRE